MNRKRLFPQKTLLGLNDDLAQNNVLRVIFDHFSSFWYKIDAVLNCLFLHYGVKLSGVNLLAVSNCPLVNQLSPGRLKVDEFDTGRWGWTIIIWLCVSANVSNSITHQLGAVPTAFDILWINVNIISIFSHCINNSKYRPPPRKH